MSQTIRTWELGSCRAAGKERRTGVQDYSSSCGLGNGVSAGLTKIRWCGDYDYDHDDDVDYDYGIDGDGVARCKVSGSGNENGNGSGSDDENKSQNAGCAGF